MAKEKNRYADAELEEFRAIIEKKLNEAKDDLLVLKGSLSIKMTTELMILVGLSI